MLLLISTQFNNFFKKFEGALINNFSILYQTLSRQHPMKQQPNANYLSNQKEQPTLNCQTIAGIGKKMEHRI